MKKEITSFIDQLCSEFDAIDWSKKENYAAYCSQLYYYVRHSTRILALGAGRMPLSEENGHKRYVSHLMEEKGHEVLAIRDCEAVGYSVHDFPELASTRAFYQTQLYMNTLVSPWAFLGYALVLEGLACKKAHALGQAIMKLHGPKSASFLKVHGNEDEDHFEEALTLLDGRTPEDQKFIFDSAEMSFYMHRQFLRDLPMAIAGHQRSEKKKAA